MKKPNGSSGNFSSHGCEVIGNQSGKVRENARQEKKLKGRWRPTFSSGIRRTKKVANKEVDNEPMERGMNDLLGFGSTFIPSTICRIGLMELIAKVDGLMSHLVLGLDVSSPFGTFPLPLR